MKEQEFDSNSPKIFEAWNVPIVQTTATGTNSLNKSTAHIEERAKELGVMKISTIVRIKVDHSLNSLWHLV